MKIKRYKLFLEGDQRFTLTDDEQEEIRNLFINYVCDDFDLEEIKFGAVTNMNEWSTMISHYDDEGNDWWRTKKRKYRSSRYLDNREEIEKEYFNYYQSIIINVYYPNESILKSLNDFYNAVITRGYICNAWKPTIGNWRFHISTKESNPFYKTFNSLKRVWGDTRH